MPYIIGNTSNKNIVTNNTITPITLNIAGHNLTSEVNQSFTNVFENLSNETFQSINWETELSSNDFENFSANNLSITDGIISDNNFKYNKKFLKLDNANNTLIIDYVDEDRDNNIGYYGFIVADSSALFYLFERKNINSSTIVNNSGGLTFWIGRYNYTSEAQLVSTTQTQAISIKLKIPKYSSISIDNSADMEILFYLANKPITSSVTSTNTLKTLADKVFNLKVKFKQTEFYPL